MLGENQALPLLRSRPLRSLLSALYVAVQLSKQSNFLERGDARGKPSTATTAFARSRLPRSLLSANEVAASVWFVGVRGLQGKWLSNFAFPEISPNEVFLFDLNTEQQEKTYKCFVSKVIGMGN